MVDILALVNFNRIFIGLRRSCDKRSYCSYKYALFATEYGDL